MKSKIKLGLGVIALMLVSTLAMADDEGKYNSWTLLNNNDVPFLRMTVGNTPSKKSGWFSLENVTTRRMKRVCYAIQHREGRDYEGCTPIDAGETERRADAGCGQETPWGGCTGVKIKGIEFAE